jgi:NAD(P)-dependent dehydrogenase (short-subunit alcohol dehydrogenase family)
MAKEGRPRSASIVNTASEAGLFGNVGQANYTFAKGGIVALSLTIHQELNRYGVRCNVICPRARTPMLENLALPPAPDGALDPLDPRQVAPLVGYLASERSAPVSGQVFAAFGGQLHHLKPWAWGSSFTAGGRLVNFDDVDAFFRTTFEAEPPVPPTPRHAMSIDQWAQDASTHA